MTIVGVGCGVGFVRSAGGMWVPPSCKAAWLVTPDYLDIRHHGAGDVDMESASTSSWNVFGSGSLAKVATAHEGSQALEYTSAGTVGHGTYQTGVVEVGKTYTATVWVKGDGDARAYFRIGTTGGVLSTPGSTEWEQLTVSGLTVAGNTYLYMTEFGGVSGSKLLWDDLQITCTEPTITAWEPVFGSAEWYQSTVSEQPAFDDGLVLTSGRKMISDSPADFTCLHDGTGGALLIYWTRTSTDTYRYLFDSGRPGYWDPGVQLKPSSNDLTADVYSGSAQVGHVVNYNNLLLNTQSKIWLDSKLEGDVFDAIVDEVSAGSTPGWDGAPSATDTDGVFIGPADSGGTAAEGKIAAMALFSDVYSSEDKALAEAWIEAQL